MDALYPRYAAFIRPGDIVVMETGSSSLGMMPMTLADGVRVEAQVLWGSIGWATPAALGMAIADPNRRVVLVTGEGSHQLTANEVGSMGRFGANIVVFVLNNGGYFINGHWRRTPTGLITTSLLGVTLNCRRLWGAPIGSRRAWAR